MPTDPRSTPMATIEAIDRQRKKTATKALDISLNELADMYESKELVIRPEYQRLFRWSEEKQSQFIESLILEMPIPPIFAIELDDGKWELIDGLQRLSTYLHFRGVLDAPDKKPNAITIGNTLELVECDILEDLNGCKFSNLPPAIQIRLKRSFLRVEVIREADNRFRYYMFKRLNTGGEQLSEQEIRNCTIRLLGDEFNNFLIRMSNNKQFVSVIGTLSDASKETMGDVELVLRFFAFKNNLRDFKHGITEFLSEYMVAVTERKLEFDYTNEEKQFVKVFSLLNRSLGENTCLRWLGRKFGGPFSMHHFEAFSVGLARVINDIGNAEQEMQIVAALKRTKKEDELKSHTQGGGKNSPGLYREKLNYVERKLRDAL